MASIANSRPLGFFQIIKESLNLLKINPKLILYVFLIHAVVSILIVSVNELSIQSLITDISSKSIQMSSTQPSDPMYYKLYLAIMNEARELAAIEILYVVVALVISVVLQVMIVSAVSANYAKNFLTLKELLCKVKSNLKGPFITQLQVTLLNLGFLALFFVFAYLIWFIGGGSFLVLVFIFFISIVAIIWYVYLCTWWYMSTIVSIIEEGCYGVGAFKRASELMEGRKWRGVSILLLYLLIVGVLYGVFGLTVGLTNNLWSQLLLTIVSEVFAFLLISAMIVYYYEGKKENEVSDKKLYNSLPSDDIAV